MCSACWDLGWVGWGVLFPAVQLVQEGANFRHFTSSHASLEARGREERGSLKEGFSARERRASAFRDREPRGRPHVARHTARGGTSTTTHRRALRTKFFPCTTVPAIKMKRPTFALTALGAAALGLAKVEGISVELEFASGTQPVSRTLPTYASWNIDSSCNRGFHRINFTNTNLREAARALRPSYLRFGGSGVSVDARETKDDENSRN